MTKKLQKKVIKKSDTKKSESVKKSESGKKTEVLSIPVKKTPKKNTTIVEGGGLGKKHTCYGCNTKFYDFGKEEKLCPKCGMDQNTKPTIKAKFPKSTPKLSEFDVVDEDVVAELGVEEDILLEPDTEVDDPEPILDEDEN